MERPRDMKEKIKPPPTPSNEGGLVVEVVEVPVLVITVELGFLVLVEVAGDEVVVVAVVEAETGVEIVVESCGEVVVVSVEVLFFVVVSVVVVG